MTDNQEKTVRVIDEDDVPEAPEGKWPPLDQGWEKKEEALTVDEATELADEVIESMPDVQPWEAYSDEGHRALLGEIRMVTSGLIRAQHWADNVKLKKVQGVEERLKTMADMARDLVDMLSD